MENDHEYKVKELGYWIGRMRERNGLTQEELAKLVKVNPKQISRYENGKAEMRALLYIRILEVLSPRTNDPQTDELLRQYSLLTPDCQRLIFETVSKFSGK